MKKAEIPINVNLNQSTLNYVKTSYEKLRKKADVEKTYIINCLNELSQNINEPEDLNKGGKLNDFLTYFSKFLLLHQRLRTVKQNLDLLENNANKIESVEENANTQKMDIINEVNLKGDNKINIKGK